MARNQRGTQRPGDNTMTKYVTEGRCNTRKSVFHTDKECQGLDRSTVREATQNEIEYFDLRLCQYCNPDIKANHPTDQDRSHLKALKEAAEE